MTSMCSWPEMTVREGSIEVPYRIVPASDTEPYDRDNPDGYTWAVDESALRAQIKVYRTPEAAEAAMRESLWRSSRFV